MKIFTILAALAALLLYGLSLSAVPADAASGRGPFCRQARGATTLYCTYNSMAECEYDARPAGDACVQNPHRPRHRAG